MVGRTMSRSLNEEEEVSPEILPYLQTLPMMRGDRPAHYSLRSRMAAASGLVPYKKGKR
jgi:hypothetical protein